MTIPMVVGTNDVAIDKDTNDECQGFRNNRYHCLKDLKKIKGVVRYQLEAKADKFLWIVGCQKID